ncbi:MAG: formate dehydrogenase accessory sulfurtransferase FdhD [Bacteroidia bacterium]
MNAPHVKAIEILKVQGNSIAAKPDLLAIEEPLEIRLLHGPEGGRLEQSISVTMRTPGHDEELVLGFLWTEGIIHSYDQVYSIRHCETVEKPEEEGNVIKVNMQPDVTIDMAALERHFYTSSSCGVCGKSSIDAVFQSCSFEISDASPWLSPASIHPLPDRLREAQKVFEYTGGIHAAGLFDKEGNLLLMREDVGRHNALDKLVGAALASGLLPLSQHVIQVSGRASFELVQKALMAGAEVMAAVGAPSSLAVSLAQKSNMTLLGFVRNERFNIYTGAERFERA